MHLKYWLAKYQYNRFKWKLAENDVKLQTFVELDFAFNSITNTFHILFEGKQSNIEVSLDVYHNKKCDIWLICCNCSTVVLHIRYIPVGLLEQLPQKINERPPYYIGRNDLETLMSSPNCGDWVKIRWGWIFLEISV